MRNPNNLSLPAFNLSEAREKCISRLRCCHSGFYDKVAGLNPDTHTFLPKTCKPQTNKLPDHEAEQNCNSSQNAQAFLLGPGFQPATGSEIPQTPPTRKTTTTTRLALGLSGDCGLRSLCRVCMPDWASDGTDQTDTGEGDSPARREHPASLLQPLSFSCRDPPVFPGIPVAMSLTPHSPPPQPQTGQ